MSKYAHPTTVLYHRQLGPKWLPCYLDMQNPHNTQLVSALAANNSYSLILFTLEPPHHCANILSSIIATAQRKKLKTWVKQSQELPQSSQSHVSKKKVKAAVQANPISHIGTSGS
jgi:hypothetical protein